MLIFPYYIRLIELYFEYKPSRKSVPCKLLFHTLFHYVFNQVNFPAHAYNYSHDIADCANHVTRITTSWVWRGSLSRSLQRTLRCSSFSLEGISSVLGGVKSNLLGNEKKIFFKIFFYFIQCSPL